MFLLLITFTAFSQRPEAREIKVSGKIIDADSSLPLEYATVAFIDQGDKIVTGGITDENGVYNIMVPSGTYTIQYEFISYKTKRLTNQNLSADTTLPNMIMEIDAESLDEIVVRAETTEVQIRLDKKVYNIGKDLTTSGATVSDALNNVPSVTVDVDGTINLRGNENVRILINGKPSAIAGFGDTDALSQLPAEAIQSVEVITSPSARYDAEGTAGILNIILRKEKTLGLNGSIQANVGYPLSGGITGNLNVRTNNFNIFNTTGIRYRESPGNAFFDNRYFSRTEIDSITGEPVIVPPNFDRTTEEREYDRTGKGFNTNLGIEYYLTESSSITAAAFYRLGDDEDVTTNITNDFQPLGTQQFSRIRTETELEDDTNLQLSLNYTNNFNTSGHKLTADFQWEKGDETQKAFIAERNTFPATEILPAEDVTEKEDETQYLLQADYVLPIGENAQFEAGYRGRFEQTETDYLLLDEVGTSGVFIRNSDLSNIFNFEQNVNALYSQYGNKFGQFSFLLGLRLESTILKGDVIGENSITSQSGLDLNFDKDYLGLFPTVNLVYELAERENITLGYNRRINRPRHWFINPFPSRSSEANIFQGNPDLDPAYASAFDVGYLKRWDKITFSSSVYYQYETDAFSRVQEDTGLETSNGIPIIRTIPINLATNQRFGFEAGILYNPAKWLRFNGSFNFFSFKSEGDFNGVDFGTEDTSWFARGSSKVTLPSNIDWQTTAFYRGPNSTAQSETEGIFTLSLAFSKDLFKNNATIGFNVRDLLNSRKRKSFTETPTFTSDSEFQWRERSFNLSFTYRFNQKKQRDRGERNGGDDGGEEFGGGA